MSAETVNAAFMSDLGGKKEIKIKQGHLVIMFNNIAKRYPAFAVNFIQSCTVLSFFFSGMLVLKMQKKLKELLRQKQRILFQKTFCAAAVLNQTQITLPAKVCLMFAKGY